MLLKALYTFEDLKKMIKEFGHLIKKSIFSFKSTMVQNTLKLSKIASFEDHTGSSFLVMRLQQFFG